MNNKTEQHSIIKDLLWRRTAKKYDGLKKISKENLDIIYESLRLSASSINSQPWKFIVLDSNDAKQRMHNAFSSEKCIFNQPHILESSQVIMFAHNPSYTKKNHSIVVDKSILDGRLKQEDRENGFKAFVFAELNTDKNGYNGNWTKAQLYIALGNLLHTLARLRIDATPIEGIDVELVNKEFVKELDGYQCDVLLAIGYSHEEDINKRLPKSRLSRESIIKVI